MGRQHVERLVQLVALAVDQRHRDPGADHGPPGAAELGAERQRLGGQLGGGPQAPAAGLGPRLGTQDADQVARQSGPVAAHDGGPAAHARPVVQQGVGTGEADRQVAPQLQCRRRQVAGSAVRSTEARWSRLEPQGDGGLGIAQDGGQGRLGDVVVHAHVAQAVGPVSGGPVR